MVCQPRAQDHSQCVAGNIRTGWLARDLALRLLALRVSRDAPPWNLNDEEPNRRFLASLCERNIYTAPWLQPRVRTVDVSGKGALSLSLEQDPLQVFYMGGYFDTCVSPEACNFFSTVAVAADVNKQVLYARDAASRVVGRCLLALTSSGGLLVFRPYYYRLDWDFCSVVGNYAQELASEMQTIVLEDGNVDCLVAREWYNDGTHPVGDQLPCLREQSKLRVSLREVRLNDVVSLLEQELAPLAINDLTLPLILSLPEFEDRPELIVPLKSKISRAGFFPHEAAVQAVRLAMKAQEEDFALHIAKQRLLPRCMRELRRGGWIDESLLRMFARLDPSLTLRVLRQTRSTGIRADKQETDPVRRRLLALAHGLLGRELRAKRLDDRTSPPESDGVADDGTRTLSAGYW